jgi:hypothetical protein
MDQREDAGTGHGEQGHGLSEPVDGGAPLLTQQQKNRRNQGAGVSNANPPDKVDDGKSPTHRDVQTPDTGTGEKELG